MKKYLKKYLSSNSRFLKESILSKFIFKKTSYSQSGEDLIIKYIFDTLKIQKPTYIDVGAHHPYYLSNTALLYKNGGFGVNVEPDPVLCEQFFKIRKRDINLNIGISSEESELDFYIMSSNTLNTFSKEDAEKYRDVEGYEIVKKEKIISKKINSVIDSLDFIPDLLCVDAEGLDYEIMDSIDFNKFSPIIICIETLSFSNSFEGNKDQKLIELILKNGYFIYADTYINTIFVKKEAWRKKNE